MEFRRITGLPPYVFTIIDGLKTEARRAGRDVVDLGFGNPDIPSPAIAVDKLSEAAHNTRNHRYSSSRGIPKLRQAVAGLYRRRFGVELDPDTEVISTIGAKEGFSHLMWVLLQAGDAALVPSPSYPIHIWGPYFAGADARQVAIGPKPDGSGDEDYVSNVMEAWEYGWPKPRVVVLSFPHNPTTTTVELADLQRLVDWARERDVVLVHDFAYAETAFDDWLPPSILQCEGAKEVAVELYSMTKSFSMAGWRVAFMVGNPEVVQALAKLKSYLDYGTFQPIQIAATVTLDEAVDYPLRGQRRLPATPRRPLGRPAADRVGDPQAARDDVRLGAHPRAVPAPRVDRLRHQAGARVRRRRLARGRLRPAGRRLRAVRADRERAPDRPGRPLAAQGPARAALTVRDAAGPTGGSDPNTGTPAGHVH